MKSCKKCSFQGTTADKTKKGFKLIPVNVCLHNHGASREITNPNRVPEWCPQGRTQARKTGV